MIPPLLAEFSFPPRLHGFHSLPRLHSFHSLPRLRGRVGWGCYFPSPACGGGSGWGCFFSSPACGGGSGWGFQQDKTNLFQDAFRLRQNLVVPETQNSEASSSEPGRARIIVV